MDRKQGGAEVTGRGGGGGRMERAQLGKVESVQRRLGGCSVSMGFFSPHPCHFVTSARASPAIISIFL